MIWFYIWGFILLGVAYGMGYWHGESDFQKRVQAQCTHKWKTMHSGRNATCIKCHKVMFNHMDVNYDE